MRKEVSKEEVLDFLVKEVKDFSQYQNITVNTKDNLAEEFGLDSLDMIEIVMNIEDEFNIDIDDTLLDQCNTVQDLLNLVWEEINGEML